MAIIVDNFDQLSKFAAGVDRLETFVRYLAEESADRPRSSAIKQVAKDSVVEVKDLTLKTPDEKRALDCRSFGKNQTWRGAHDRGAQRWRKEFLAARSPAYGTPAAASSFARGPRNCCFCHSARTWCWVSLRSQLLYPHHHRDITDEELLQLLNVVNLPHLADQSGGLDAELDWEDVLSVGEQQRLAIARVLLIKPRYAMLDEATSALDIRNEERIYKQLKATSTTLVSVSHHPTILKYHEQVLELTGDGKWKIQPARDYSLS